MKASDNILGTVSQSSGVPTGAIIESGVNANGYYAKFASGTLICGFLNASVSTASSSTAAGAVYVGETVTWTFPSAFSASPYVSPYCIRAVGTWAHWAQLRTIPTTTAASLSMITATASGTGTVGAIAIGRWY